MFVRSFLILLGLYSDRVSASARTVSYSFSFVYIRALGVKIHTYIFFFCIRSLYRNPLLCTWIANEDGRVKDKGRQGV